MVINSQYKDSHDLFKLSPHQVRDRFNRALAIFGHRDHRSYAQVVSNPCDRGFHKKVHVYNDHVVSANTNTRCNNMNTHSTGRMSSLNKIVSTREDCKHMASVKSDTVSQYNTTNSRCLNPPSGESTDVALPYNRDYEIALYTVPVANKFICLSQPDDASIVYDNEVEVQSDPDHTVTATSSTLVDNDNAKSCSSVTDSCKISLELPNGDIQAPCTHGYQFESSHVPTVNFNSTTDPIHPITKNA